MSIDFRASTNTMRPSNPSFASETTLKGPTTTKLLKTPLKTKSNVNLRSSVTPSKSTLVGPGSIMTDKSPTSIKKTPKLSHVKSGSNRVGTEPLRPRGPVGGLFHKPSIPELDRGSTGTGIGAKNASAKRPETASQATPAASGSPVLSISNMDNIADQRNTPRKSSFALREQIAKAKAAKRAQTSRQASGTQKVDSMEEFSIIPAGTFDFGLMEDPFNQQRSLDATKGLLRKRVDSARMDGRLNIAAMGLKEIPAEVTEMYNFDAMNSHCGSWAESVDLTRFIAADNEFEVLGDDIFPDIDPQELLNDDDSKGNIFGGLETLDLHGNLLKTLPLGLRRLELLTTLNLVRILPCISLLCNNFLY